MNDRELPIIGPFPVSHKDDCKGVIIQTKCRKCGETINIHIPPDYTREQVIEAAKSLDHTPGHCPGWHCELGGWFVMWNMERAINDHFDRIETDIAMGRRKA